MRAIASPDEHQKPAALFFVAMRTLRNTQLHVANPVWAWEDDGLYYFASNSAEQQTIGFVLRSCWIYWTSK